MRPPLAAGAGVVMPHNLAQISGSPPISTVSPQSCGSSPEFGPPGSPAWRFNAIKEEQSMIPGETEKRRFRDSIAIKIAVIGALILMLLIPLGMVDSLVSERQSREKQASKEVADSWGRPQTLAGPVLTVPYLIHVKNEKGLDIGTQTSWVRFLPETLKIDGNVETERRNRGIFEVAVYRTGLHWAGTFQRPSFESWHVEPNDILWRDAYLAIGVPDMRGITSGVGLTWGNRTLQLVPGGAE